MVEEATGNSIYDTEVSWEEAEAVPPAYTIFNLPIGSWGKIPEIKYVNFYPTRAAKRHDRRTRQVVQVLAVDPGTGMMPIVQPAKAGSNEWSLIQGGIERNETAFEAVHREAHEEASVTLTDVVYVGSYRAPVDESSVKKEDYDYQLFHCFVACTNDVRVQSQCDGVTYAAMFHQYDALPVLWRTASAVKQELLPPLFQAAVEHGLLSPRACRRE